MTGKPAAAIATFEGKFGLPWGEDDGDQELYVDTLLYREISTAQGLRAVHPEVLAEADGSSYGAVYKHSALLTGDGVIKCVSRQRPFARRGSASLSEGGVRTTLTGTAMVGSSVAAGARCR